VNAPNTAPDTAPAPRPSRRKRRLLLGIGLLGVVLLLALSVRVALQPENLTRVLLERVGKALALEISAGSGEYRLRGTPQLVLRDLVAREAGAAKPILIARRVAIAVPWRTLRSRGALLEVQRVELEGAVLDLPALQAWQAKRPPGETRIPTLTDGLSITGSRLDAGSWQVEGIGIDIPALHPRQPLAAHVAGRYVDGPTSADFDLRVALAKPASSTGAAAFGSVSVVRDAADGERKGWRLHGKLRLSGPLRLDGGALRITPAHVGLSARYTSGDTRLPFALGLHGPLLFRNATLAIAPAGIAMRGEGALPVFDAHGRVALGQRLLLKIAGQLPGWKDEWPALPPPLGQSDSPLPFELRYLGKADASDTSTLRLRRDDTRFDGRFRFPEVLRWAGAEGDTSPLPPLDGRVTTPQLEVSGATLHGVEVELDDPDIEAAP
jgi:hypothetical protein